MVLEYESGERRKRCDIYVVEEHAKKLGEDATIGQLLVAMKGSRIHRCPKCNGRGYVAVKYNAYPEGLPDSGWVEEWKLKDVKCSLCKGHGWNEKEHRPKMVQRGWEECSE